MRLFRRDEPLHVRLAREAGVSLNGEPVEAVEPQETVSRPPPAPQPSGLRRLLSERTVWDGALGLPRLSDWDVVETVDFPENSAERAVFVALPNGDLVIEEGPDDVQPLAEAVERELAPPYRAEGVRRDDGLWAVGARAIEVVKLPGIEGDEIELASHGSERTLLVDGMSSHGTVRQLERAEHVVRATRIDGDNWEVAFDPL
jgi:hypothetical protein